MAPTLSLAGATANPAPAPIPQRVGGFGGVEGLTTFLIRERIGAVIDATHPFACRMSANAATACRATATPLVVFTRPAWPPRPGDRWIEVATIEEAVDALGLSQERFSSRKVGSNSLPSSAHRSTATSCAPSTGQRRSTRCSAASSSWRAARSLSLMSSH